LGIMGGLEFVQPLQQHAIARGAELLLQCRFMLRGQRLGPSQQLLAVAGESKGMAASVAGGGQALREAAPLQPVQQPHQPRALDAQGSCQLRLREPGAYHR